MKSTFLKLAANDLFKGFIMAMLVAIVAIIQPVMEAGSFPTFDMLWNACGKGLIVGILYLIKNLFTNSNDQFLKGEVK